MIEVLIGKAQRFGGGRWAFCDGFGDLCHADLYAVIAVSYGISGQPGQIFTDRDVVLFGMGSDDGRYIDRLLFNHYIVKPFAPGGV